VSDALAVVDAHHHVWAPSRFRYAWLDPAAGGLARDYLAGDYRRDVTGVRVLGSVLVEAGQADPVAEAGWLAGAATQLPHPAAVIGRIRLQDPDAAARLATLRQAGVHGVRQVLNPPDPALGATQYAADADALITDPAWRRGLALLGPLGLPFDLQVLPHQLTASADLAGEFPETTFVLDHAGYMTRRTAELDAIWRAGVRTLAKRPNVLVKASDYSTVDPAFGRPGFRDFVRELVDVFGPGRTLFAGNFPHEGRAIGFADLVAHFAAALSDLTAGQRADVLAGNARTVYRLADVS
jgi:predicted TIM-barrel fold metal-dependent hydrolase